MLTLTQTRLKTLLAGLMAVFTLSVLGSIVTPSDSAYAADYPNRWCTFKEASDGKSFTASCTDDKDNGGFHDVVFKSSGKDTYSFTDSFWTTSGVRIPVTSHEKPDGNSATGQAPVETKCKPATIKVANNEGTISGQYASQTTEGGLARWTCTDLLAGKVSIDRGLVRLTAWRDTLYQSLLKSLPPIECERFNKGSNNYNQCASAVAIAVNACVGDNGSVWKETMSYADMNEQKEAYKKTAVDCLDGRLSQASRADIRNAVNNAQQNADEEESKIVDTEGGEDEEDVLAETTSCAIDGIGWLVCPVLTFIGKLNDAAFNFLTKFLGIQPAVIMSEPTRNAWSAFRDIANVAFVIAFMVIVYSQITSAGISNYGIKKMLPRIVVAAILVNISFYLCAIAVDISNIVGASVFTLLKDSIDVGSEIQTTQWESSMSDILGIAATGIGIVLLVVAITMAPAVLLAFVLIILILVARQALVILLIVISPLAFVAYLLPNTEDWFKKWWKAFVTTLMVYPIVGLVFGASTLASSVLVQVGQGGEGDDQQLLMLIALGVAAVPLFAVPAILKGSLSAAGSIGARLSGMADRSQNRATKQFQKKAQEYSGDARNRWNMAAANGKLGVLGRPTQRRMKRDFLRSSRESEAKRAESSYTTGLLEGDSPEALKLQRAAGGGIAGAPGASVRASAFATQQAHKRFDEDVAAHKTTMSGMSNSQLLEKLKSGEGGDEYQAALAGTIMSRSHRESHLEALEIVRQRSQDAEASGDHVAQETLSGVQKQMAHDMKDKPWALGDQAAGQLVEGTYGKSKSNAGEAQTHFTSSIDQQLNDRVGTKLSAQSLATMNPDEMKRIHAAALNGDLDKNQMAVLKAKIAEVRKNQQMNALVKPEAQAQFDQILTLSDPLQTNRSPNNAATQQEAIDINNTRDAKANRPDEGTLF